MRRVPDRERDILLGIERHEGGSQINLTGIHENDDVVYYHMRLLDDAGYILAKDASSMDSQFAMIPIRLTIAGHEYLDNIRSSEIWQKTKDSAEAAGSFGLEILSELAKGLVRQKIKHHTGIDIGQ